MDGYNSKYVVFDCDGLKVMVVFSTILVHKDVARGLCSHLCKPISAGFITNGKTYGRSESLNLSSKEEDQELFNKLIGGVHE